VPRCCSDSLPARLCASLSGEGLMQDILGDPKVQLVPAGDEAAPLPKGPEIDLAPHTRSNVAMKLAVVRSLWSHAHSVLPVQALAGSPSEALPTWLMKKEAELVWETDTPHDARMQWATLCAEVVVRTGAAGCSPFLAPLCMFRGTPGAGRGTGPWTFVRESGVCLWSGGERSRRDGKRHPCFSACHSRKSPFPVSSQRGVLMDSCVGAREQR
jgi:hypothetical protein